MNIRPQQSWSTAHGVNVARPPLRRKPSPPTSPTSSSTSTPSSKIGAYQPAADSGGIPSASFSSSAAPSAGSSAYDSVSARPTSTSAPSGTKLSGWKSSFVSCIAALPRCMSVYAGPAYTDMHARTGSELEDAVRDLAQQRQLHRADLADRDLLLHRGLYRRARHNVPPPRGERRVRTQPGVRRLQPRADRSPPGQTPVRGQS